MTIRKPTKSEIQNAYGGAISDIIDYDLRVLFCGINPSLYSVAVGHHFARPGNRFWATLFAAGFTDRLYSPSEDRDLLKLGYGLTNVASCATARADELAPEELIAGHMELAQKVQRYRPKCLAVLGVSAYRVAFNQPKAAIGQQKDLFHGALLWVLPNPSGLNAHYQIDDLKLIYQQLQSVI